MPPEAIFLAVVMLLATWLYSLASAPRSPAAPASITDIAPSCADARQPCRGRVSS
jgi:hypothetical protein